MDRRSEYRKRALMRWAVYVRRMSLQVETTVYAHNVYYVKLRTDKD